MHLSGCDALIARGGATLLLWSHVGAGDQADHTGCGEILQVAAAQARDGHCVDAPVAIQQRLLGRGKEVGKGAGEEAVFRGCEGKAVQQGIVGGRGRTHGQAEGWFAGRAQRAVTDLATTGKRAGGAEVPRHAHGPIQPQLRVVGDAALDLRHRIRGRGRLVSLP